MIQNFDKLTFYRKIDVLVAMHVMEWKNIVVELGQPDIGYGTYWLCKGNPPGPIVVVWDVIPCYSTLLTSSWDIVRKFEYCYLWRDKESNINNGMWECKLFDPKGELLSYGEGRKYYGLAETEMLAICYAGLKAVEYLIDDFLKEEGKI